MVGQGRPSTRRKLLAPWVGLLLAVLFAAPVAMPRARATVSSEVQQQPQTMVLRIAWGGGAERQWHGSISLDKGTVEGNVEGADGTLKLVRPLGIVADSPGSIWSDGPRQIEIHERSPRAYDGIDLEVTAVGDPKLTISLSNDADAHIVVHEVRLSDLVAKMYRAPLGDKENLLLIRRGPCDVLRVVTDRDPLIFTPGETWKPTVEPHLLPVAAGTTVYVKTRLIAARGGSEAWSREQTIKTGAADAVEPTLPLEIKLPEQEGAYDLVIEASERGALRWPKPIAERRVQILVLAADAPPAPVGSNFGGASATSSTAGAVSAATWTQLMEIDPANPHWYERLRTIPRIPGILPNGAGGLWSGPLGSGGAQAVQNPLGRLIQLPAAAAGADPAWQAYPLSVSKPGVPHIVEIEYPADVPQTLGISIVEPNAAGVIGPIGLDSGVYISDALAPAAAGWAKHRLIFWPRTAAPTLLLTNRRDGGRAMYGKIRLYSGPARLRRAFDPADQQPERLLAGYFDRPLLAANFSASESLDPFTGRSLTDWQTFYEGGTRLTDYLNSVGYNGLMLAVLSEGSTIYPSKLLEPTPRFDTGAFFDQGQDPLRKDVLEMVLRLFDREHLRLIPALQFSAPLPELETLLRSGSPEEIAGLQPIGADGVPWITANSPRHGLGLAPYYNPLDERVQNAMLGVIRELMARYGKHVALSGLAIELSADGYAQLPGEAWGLDDRTIARFEHDTRQTVPGDGPGRYAQRAEFVTGPGRRDWLLWRAGVLADFHRRIRRELSAARADMRLYLTPTNMLDLPELDRDLRPGLPSRGRIAEALAAVGIRPDEYRDETGIVLLRPQRVLPPGPLAAQSVAIENNRSTEWDELSHAAASPGSLCYHEPQRQRLASFDAKSPLGKEKTFTWLVSQFSPSQDSNRQRFIHSIATLDSQSIFDGGWLLPLGQEASLADLVAVYRRIPAARFETLADCPQPVTIRTLSAERQTYAYLANDSAWRVRVQVQLDAPPDCRPTELAGRHHTDIAGSVWTVDLGPYDLAAVSFPSKDVHLKAAQVALDPQLRKVLESAIGDLHDRRMVLESPPPMQGLNNAGFETPTHGSQIPSWTVNGAGKATLDVQDPHGGRQSLHLSGTGALVTLRSDPFPVSQTGRIALSVWLRIQGGAPQPQIRLALEGLPDSERYFRGALLGQNPAMQIPSQWKQFIFPLDDIPPEGLTQLRFRIDLSGPGDVWIDDVQLFDLVFTEAEKIQLSKIISLAEFQLNAGQLGDCLYELEGYWPRLLAAQVPLPPPPLAAAAQNPPAAAAGNPPAAAPAKGLKDLWKF